MLLLVLLFRVGGEALLTVRGIHYYAVLAVLDHVACLNHLAQQVRGCLAIVDLLLEA